MTSVARRVDVSEEVLMSRTLLVPCSPLASRAARASAFAAAVFAPVFTLAPLAAHGQGLAVEPPVVHENLSVFLLRGPSALGAERILTLGEAIAAKKVRVNETQDVNALTLENLSDETVFVQAGDIVKGGQQDRTLGTDMILPKRSGKVKIAAFCVESGRWQRRGREEVRQFSSSSKALSSKALKLAARKSKDQGEVWSEVSKVQAKLEKNLARGVKDQASASSLQLTLEHPNVTRSAATYTAALAKLPEKVPDAVGFAFAVDGRLSTVEVYGSSALFRAAWPKLLDAAVVEALAERGEAPAPVQPADVAAVKAKLARSPARTKQEKLPAKVVVETYEGKDETVFETKFEDGRLIRQSRY
jgi:hypothetical protein